MVVGSRVHVRACQRRMWGNKPAIGRSLWHACSVALPHLPPPLHRTTTQYRVAVPPHVLAKHCVVLPPPSSSSPSVTTTKEMMEPSSSANGKGKEEEEALSLPKDEFYEVLKARVAEAMVGRDVVASRCVVWTGVDVCGGDVRVCGEEEGGYVWMHGCVWADVYRIGWGRALAACNI